MKRILFPFLFSCCFHFAYPQGYSLKILDVNQPTDKQIISVNVFVQNLGEGNYLWNCYGYNYECEKSSLNFFIEYDLYSLGWSVKRQPSSITVKTILGGYIAMEQPRYYFPVTGTESGEYWNIVFSSAPKDAGNVVISILGKRYIIGDMPGAAAARLQLAEKLKNEKELKEKLEVESYTQALILAKKAEEYYNQKDYDNAINGFLEAISTDKTGQIKNSYKEKLADSYLSKANKYYKTKEYDKSCEFYKNAIKYDYTLKPKISSLFQGYQRKLGVFSLLPGIGQYKNRQPLKGTLLLGLASAGVGGSIYLYSQSKSKFENYKNSTDITEIPKLYDNAESLRKFSIYCGLFAGAISLYSIIDANITTHSYNKLWKMDGETFSFAPMYLPNENFYGMVIKMKF